MQFVVTLIVTNMVVICFFIIFIEITPMPIEIDLLKLGY